MNYAKRIMEQIRTYEPPVGGRVSSPKFRASLQRAEEFNGLEEDVNRFHALKLIKKAGKDAGFTAELIELLEYYLVRTDEIDWTEGNQPICYQSVVNTAQDLDISERQVRNRERALNALGALTWEDSGNFKRYGVRDRETRRIMYAFGVDLSPLASLIPILEYKVEEKKALKALWGEHKRKISGLRARIRALLAEASHHNELEALLEDMQHDYEDISYSIRTYHRLDALKALLEKHQIVYQSLIEALDTSSKAVDNTEITDNTSSREEIDYRHIQCTNKTKSNKLDTCSNPPGISFQESVPKVSVRNGEDSAFGKEQKETELATKTKDDISKVTWKQMLNACSERFKNQIPIHDRPLSWEDLLDAAYQILPDLGINKATWWQSCQILGRHGAAICVMIIDQKAQDPHDPVRNPGGYLREMTARAKKGELNLHGSVFGLLKREKEKYDA